MTVEDKDLKARVKYVIDSTGSDTLKARMFNLLAAKYGKDAVVKCFSEIVDEAFGITKGEQRG